MAAEPDVVERERTQAQFRDQDGPCVFEAAHHGSVFGGNAISVGLRSVGGGDAGGVEQILRAPRNAVERPAVFSGGDFLVGGLRMGKGGVARERDDTVEFGIELLEAFR